MDETWNGVPLSEIGAMTHWPEQSNPVHPIIEAVRRYLQSGDYNPMHEPGTQPADYLRELARNPEIMAKNIDQASQFNFGGTTKGLIPLSGIGSGVPEKIQAAATRYGGKVYTGNVHYQSLEAAAQDHGMNVSQFIEKINKEAGKTEATHDLDGFITSNGRFVNRDEARQIADRADQLTGLAKRENNPKLSMEELKIGERPGFGQPSFKGQ